MNSSKRRRSGRYWPNTGKLPVDAATIVDDTDLYQAGLTSHASVSVMLALEDAFDIEFPERMLKKSTFESVAAIQRRSRSSSPATR